MSEVDEAEVVDEFLWMAIGYFIAKMLKDAGVLPKEFAKLIEEDELNIVEYVEMKLPLECRN